MTKLKTLIVERNWYNAYVQTTTLKDCNGKVKAIISSSLKQPRYGLESIIINCNRFLLDWSKVEYTTGGKKIKKRIL